MSFIWLDALWALLLLPLLVLGYLWLLKRRKKAAVTWASLGLVKEALGAQPAWRRHVPPALLLLALAALLVATARPTAVVTLPLVEQTIVLAMDVSGSMRAGDVEPNRLVASQNAAKAFVAELPRSVRVAVVSVRRHRRRRAAAHTEPRRCRGRDRPLPVAARDSHRQRHRARLATIFPDAGIDLSQITGQRLMPQGAR